MTGKIPPTDGYELGVPYLVYGNAAAEYALDALDDGRVVRFLISEGERAFVADHVRLPDGRIAMASSKSGVRHAWNTSEVEFGYGIARAHHFVVLEYHRSLFNIELEDVRYGDTIDPDELPTDVETEARA